MTTHITNDGKLGTCRALSISSCPFAKNGHFNSVEDGEEYFAEEAEAYQVAVEHHPSAKNVRVIKFDRSNWESVYSQLGFKWSSWDRSVGAPDVLEVRGGYEVLDGDWVVESGNERKSLIGIVRKREVKR